MRISSAVRPPPLLLTLNNEIVRILLLSVQSIDSSAKINQEDGLYRIKLTLGPSVCLIGGL